MRLVSWPSAWDKDKGLLPIEAQEIDFHATAEELQALAQFFTEAAEQATQSPSTSFEKFIDLKDSKIIETTPICVTVHHGNVHF